MEAGTLAVTRRRCSGYDPIFMRSSMSGPDPASGMPVTTIPDGTLVMIVETWYASNDILHDILYNGQLLSVFDFNLATRDAWSGASPLEPL